MIICKLPCKFRLLTKLQFQVATCYWIINLRVYDHRYYSLETIIKEVKITGFVQKKIK